MLRKIRKFLPVMIIQKLIGASRLCEINCKLFLAQKLFSKRIFYQDRRPTKVFIRLFFTPLHALHDIYICFSRFHTSTLEKLVVSKQCPKLKLNPKQGVMIAIQFSIVLQSD